MRLLIADDNVQITQVLKAFAEKDGFSVDICHDGQSAYDLYKENSYDLLLLDIMMPKMDGYELLKRIRKESMVPVILITAKGEDYERIMGLDFGADDYIVKPFSVAEVMARVRAVLRRAEPTSQDSRIIQEKDLTLDLDSYSVQVADQDIQLTKKEFDVLWTLVKYKGKVFTRENLLDSLWGYDYEGDFRTVDTHIKRLRAKLPDSKEWAITTLRGLGYKFEVFDE